MTNDWTPQRRELTDAERAELMARVQQHNEDKRRRWEKRMEYEGKRTARLEAERVFGKRPDSKRGGS